MSGADDFVPCEACDTMVRFEDYNEHIEECVRYNMAFRLPDRFLDMLSNQSRHVHDDMSDGDDDGDNEGGDDNGYDGDDLIPAYVPHVSTSPTFTNNIFNQLYHQIQHTTQQIQQQHQEILNRHVGGSVIPNATLSSSLSSGNGFQEAASIAPPLTVNTLLPLNIDDLLMRYQSRRRQEVQDEPDSAEVQEQSTSNQITWPYRTPFRLIPNDDSQNARDEEDDGWNWLATTTSNARLVVPQMRNPFSSRSENDYEFNLMLSSLIGTVEKGIEDIDSVSTVVDSNVVPDDAMCTICQEDFKSNEAVDIVRKLKCDHYFCDDCIQKWLSKHVKCPVCMIDLTDNTVLQPCQNQ